MVPKKMFIVKKIFFFKVPQKDTILNKFEQEYSLTFLSINHKK